MSTRTPPPAPEPLPGPLVDSHCHLDICAADGGPSVEHAMAQAREVGITKVVQVGCDVPSSRWAADIAAANDDIWAAVALHPNEAPRLAANEGPAALAAAWTVIDELADLPAVRAIGETGMDFFRTGEEGRAIQEESFRRHIQIAQRVGKTLVVHDRDSHDDVIRILDDEGSPETVVLHCFSGDADFAKAAARRGWYCSFAGVVTFKNAVDLRAALVEVPADRLLVETDAPFLTPVPYRGKPNGPYLVPLTVRAMAEVRGEPLDELIATIWDNSERAFGPL
ncbi:MAG: TatD family hydrolase [Candidatus Nanopelagicales bacterium]|nr:TatD family hydrolase [Candidatus Nanopelagicales bacterium]